MPIHRSSGIDIENCPNGDRAGKESISASAFLDKRKEPLAVGLKILTFKKGFIIGAGVGLVAWAFVHGYLVFVPAPRMAAGLLSIIAGTLFMFAVAMGIISAFKGSSVFGTTTDGFIYGFVTIFDLFWVIGMLGSGYLPVP